MTQSDSHSGDALDDLVNRVKSRRAEGKRPRVFVTQTGGLRPSEMLSMPAEQKKLIFYLSHRRYASMDEIEQALEMDQAHTLGTLSVLKDAGYVHETLVNGEILYRVKFIDTTVRSHSLPKELWNMLSLESSAFLRQLSLFKKLSEAELGSLSQQFKNEHYDRNDIIVKQGDLAKSFFIIKSGVVAVTNLCKNGDSNVIRYLEQGDFFGESGLLTGQSISATVVAFTPVDILVINKDDFFSMLRRHPEATIELAKTLAYLLSDINTRIANKLVDSNLFLVVSTGKQTGATTIANAMTLMSAASKASTALLEFPGNQLPSIYGFPSTEKVFNHPGNFQILNPENGADLPEQERAVLALDQASAQFKNIIITISYEIIEQLDTLIRSASQIVVVTSDRQEDWAHAQRIIGAIRPYIRTNKTRLFTVINHSQPITQNEVLEATPDFTVPYLGSLSPISERRLENLPKPLTTTIFEIFKQLRYTNQIGIYIPTTIDAEQQAIVSNCIEKTFSFMRKTFGSATQEKVQGLWNSQDAGLVENDIHLVKSYCSQPVLDKYMNEVIDYVENLKQELQQETMALEINQKLMLI